MSGSFERTNRAFAPVVVEVLRCLPVLELYKGDTGRIA